MKEKDKEQKIRSSGTKKFWILDILVLVVFLFTAALGLYLFRQDLMQTLDSRDTEPVGTIIIRQNIVQRRHDDRTIWDRLFVESPVYSGDLIRVADYSAASVFIEDNQLNVNENTIIRIQQLAGARGSFEVELQEGNISLTAGSVTEQTGSQTPPALLINLMGNRVQASEGAVLNAAVSSEGMSLQVNEGSASLIEDDPQGRGQTTRQLTEGSMVAKDTRGMERLIPAAVVMRPRPNARYLKHDSAPLLVNFSWRRINLSGEDKLSLELSMDRTFSNDVFTLDNLDSSVQAAFDAGVWYWRITLDSRVLSSGEITVVDSSGPQLLSPVIGSVFNYSDSLPQIRFQWSERAGASHYALEISQTPQFDALLLNREVSSNSSIQSGIGEGTWYWRVKPFFPSAYEGRTEYSRVASFIIGRSSRSSGVEIPDPDAIAAISAGLPGAPGQDNRRTELSQLPAVIPTLSRNRVPARAAQSEKYTVKPGDTLTKIAREVYGDSSQWIRIFEANNIRNENLIYPGQEFIIP